MPQVLEINSPGELEAYQNDWTALLRKTRGASFFHTLEWLLAYWKHFGRDQRLRVLLVLEAGQPIGIMPLTVTREQTRIGRVRVLTYPLADWGSFYGPIGPDPAATLLAGLRHIQSTPHDWDMLDLRFVNRTAVDHGRTPTALACADFQAWEGAWKETAVIDLSGTWDNYWDQRTSKFRNNLRRCGKRVQELGQVTFERYRPGGAEQGEDDPRWNDYEALIDLARRSWQGGSHDGTTLSHASIEPFIRETHALAARLGMLDVNLLRLDGVPVAYAYNYVCQGEVTGLRMGYDPAYLKCGAGNVLFWRSVVDSFSRGDVLYDLGPGSLEIKRHWCTRTVSSYRYTHYSAFAPRVQLLRLNRWLRQTWMPNTVASILAENEDTARIDLARVE